MYLRGGLDSDAEAGEGGEGDEHFEAGLFPFGGDQVGDTELLVQHDGFLGLSRRIAAQIEINCSRLQLVAIEEPQVFILTRFT
jgi:hypothetical protein